MLTLICGLPRAGKTTYAQRYGERVLHSDHNGQLGVLGLVSDIHGDDVVVEGVYNLARDRVKLLADYNGTDATCVWLDTSLDIRSHRPMWTHHCEFPFEPPTYEEGWDEIIVLKDNGIFD